MFTHVTVGTDDLAAAQRFYDAVFAALGTGPGVIDAKGRLVYQNSLGRFLVTRPIDDGAASAANGGTIGFAAPSPEAIHAWHDAGVAQGGTSCEDPPGLRNLADGRALYLAYLRDPAGNKLCAVHRVQA
ncbi:MAG: VOC family protein [Sphingomonas sp.]|uniref:VOC family protein n=1 Tax=Sphingomonas sp. TaxID=28214 RepID=UPI001B1CC7B3|nr:VOC family protein [Sphingomonas sp.]MBO9624490.1 VOC family protein [Sphingomonas sp.]